MRMKIRPDIAFVITLFFVIPVQAHEFWLTPVTTPLVAGESAPVTLRVGEYFEGDIVGFSAPQTLALRRYSAAGNAEKAGRERYRRLVKTLIRIKPAADAIPSATAKPDTTHATATGQRLEILPMTDPLALAPGDVLSVRVSLMANHWQERC